MRVYRNALTWAHAPELLAAEIREALRVDLHLQLCHEFPSVLDTGSARQALEFKQIIDASAADLKKSPTNLYALWPLRSGSRAVSCASRGSPTWPKGWRNVMAE
jgi:hypothetical protein